MWTIKPPYRILCIAFFLFISSVSANSTRTIITSDGTELFVTVKGKGSPCLYIHGGPGSGSYWLEKFMGDALEQHFQMVYLDQRGVGRSGSPADQNYSMDRLVMDFEEVRQALEIDQWFTMGHSFGGLMQMGYAMRHPQAIKGMLMINTSLNIRESFEKSWCPKASEFLGLREELPCLADSLPLLERWGKLIELVNQQGVFWKMAYTHKQNMDTMNKTFGEIPGWNWDQGNVLMDVEDYWIDFKPYTPAIHVPVLFYYGNSDWMVGPEHFKGVNFPNMILWESNVGHMPFMENQEDLIKAINAFRLNFDF